jgi:uncharacterized membrane protein
MNVLAERGIAQETRGGMGVVRWRWREGQVPFILLNLVFSAVAFYTGALVIIAQKAQTRTDKANEEASAAHLDADVAVATVRSKYLSIEVSKG